jgi:hypothetical protein
MALETHKPLKCKDSALARVLQMRFGGLFYDRSNIGGFRFGTVRGFANDSVLVEPAAVLAVGFSIYPHLNIQLHRMSWFSLKWKRTFSRW